MTTASPMKDLLRPEIDTLPGYNAGVSLEKMRTQLGLARIVKLDSNENPLPPSPHVGAALARLGDDLFRYPDREELRLRALIGRSLDLDEDRLAFGAGSEDLISLLFRVVLRPGDTILTTAPAFGMYEIAAHLSGATTRKIPLTSSWRFPVEGIRRALADEPRILVLNSPCNPAGTVLAPDDLHAILGDVRPATLVVLDEAYVEFIAEDPAGPLLPRLRRHIGPWVGLRTFSKAYGLAGLRIGYMMASDPVLAQAVYKVRSPFNVNAAALIAAEAAYGDREHIVHTRRAVVAERARVAAAPTALGLDPVPSGGNFLFVDVARPARDVAAALRARGVLVKPWLEAGYDTFIRITIGGAEDDDACLEALAAVLASPEPTRHQHAAETTS